MPEQTIHPSPDYGAEDTDNDVADQAAGRFTRYDPPCQQTHDEAKNDPGKNSQRFSSWSTAAVRSFAPTYRGKRASGGPFAIMKRTFICLLVTLALATATVRAATPPDSEITASGTGSVSLPPDIATVNASIETTAASANEAISQNNEIYNRVVTALGKLGVARNDIALAYYNVNYNPRPQVMPPAPTGDRYGYTVSRGFSVKVREIGKAGRVSDACTSAGATSINGVTFGLSDPNAARGRATAKAVAEARANAEAVARAADLHIVGIKSIELTGAPSAPMPLMRAAAMPNSPTEFDQSNVSVTVSVSVVFSASP